MTKQTRPPQFGGARVGSQTLNKVRYEMATSRRALSVSEIRQRVGKSYHTIRAALEELGAEQVPASYPALWLLPAELAELKQIGGKGQDVVMVPYKPVGDVVGRWNAAREKFAERLAAVEIQPDKNPAALSKLFNEAATTLASIAYEIEHVSEGPDWYERLGGTR